MLTVQNYRLVPNNVAFKGKDEDSEVKPYKTHAGLKTGAGFFTADAGIVLGSYALGREGLKFMKEVSEDVELDKTSKGVLDEGIKMFKQSGKALKYTLPLAALVALGCGALVDKCINDKQAAFADKVNEEGSKETLATEDRADTTRSGNVYYKSNIGKKIGTLLGAVAYPAWVKVNSAIAKVKSPIGIISGVIIGALGGLTLGAITDKVANNGARKHADKQAVINE